jgi:hypothetical protein
MQIKELQELGGFVSPTPEKQEVTWHPPTGEPVTFSVHIKKLSGGAIERLWSKTSSDQSNAAALIAASVTLGDDGKDQFTYQQAFDLEPTLMEVLLGAVDKVNPLKKRSVSDAKN